MEAHHTTQQKNEVPVVETPVEWSAELQQLKKDIPDLIRAVKYVDGGNCVRTNMPAPYDTVMNTKVFTHIEELVHMSNDQVPSSLCQLHVLCAILDLMKVSSLKQRVAVVPSVTEIKNGYGRDSQSRV